jgi:predicted protein tyrosine phosphatase
MMRTDEGKILIEVASRAEASNILSSSHTCSDVTCLVSIGEAHNELPEGYDNVAHKLRLVFADTIAPENGPTENDVRRIIELAETLCSTSGRVLIHCEAGVSRSSAAALIMYAHWLGPGREREAIAKVLAQRPVAKPNRRMVELADTMLDRGGQLIEAMELAY